MLGRNDLVNFAILATFLSFTKVIDAQTKWSISETLDRDGKYNVTRWVDMDAKRIDFEVEVETSGFVGFGLSYTGDMVGADIVIGGVHDDAEKTVYFTDRHATARAEPIIDYHQDWHLISATEGDGITTLKFYRNFVTCDDEDIPISDDTLKMIWAYGTTDDVQYHGTTRRGMMSVNLLDPPQPSPDLSSFGQWDVLIEDTMPTQDTSYWCSVHKAPAEIDRKRYMVGFEAQLPDEAAETHTHHFIFRRCLIPQNAEDKAILEKYLGQPGMDCQIDKPDLPIQFCQPYLFVWAKGGQRTMFPEKVGFPIGEHVGDEYFMLEIHYDNPEKLAGVKFTTGLKVYYADEREIDAGLMTIGHNVYWGHTIPPNSVNWLTIGHCAPECTNASVPETGIQVFNVLLHAHLSGRRLKVRHFRDGKELPWLANDDNYDFNYQQNRPLRQEISVLPGDQLTYECITDTTWKNGELTIGALGTRDEMCEAFIMYYPRIDLDFCASISNTDYTLEVLGIGVAENPNDYNNPLITSPENMAGKTYIDALENVFDWTPRARKAYQDVIVHPDHYYQCASFNAPEEATFGFIKYPYVKPYEPENICKDFVPITTTTVKVETTTVTVTEPTTTTPTPTTTSTTTESNNAANWKQIDIASISTMICLAMLLLK